MNFKSLATAWLASAILVGLSILLFGAAPSGPGVDYIGYGPDSQSFIWFLNWFPFAWHHHFDLFWTDFVSAPTGMSLAWRTSIPALGLGAAPLTMKFGAVATYNGLMCLAPGLAGVGMFWAARELTGRTLPAFVAGCAFGFSPYEMAQSLSHLNLAFTVAVPLLGWAFLRAIRCEWSPVLLALVTGVLFAFQFGVSQEIAASFFALAVLAAGWIWVRDPGLRPILRRLMPGTLGGLAVAFVLISPLLFAMLFGGQRADTAIAAPADISTDLLNFVVPTPVTLPFAHLAAPLSLQFKGNFGEDAGYLGLPLVCLLVWIHVRHPERKIRLSLELAAAAAILSIGPLLHVAGYAILPAPWLVVSWLPVLHDMLPGRFMLYAWLALALGLAVWLAQPDVPKILARRFLMAVGACAFCMPNAAQVGHWTRVNIPAIFTSHGPNAIPAGANVFVLPVLGDRTVEQVESGMHFRLVAQGELGAGIPRPFSQWPLMVPLYNNQFGTVDPSEFQAFLASYGVQDVLVERDSIPEPAQAAALVTAAGWQFGWRLGSVDVYLPPKQSPPSAVLAREQAAYFREAQLNTLEHRERINVCAIRRTDAAIGLHPVIVWSLYRRYFNPPLPFGSITCGKIR